MADLVIRAATLDDELLLRRLAVRLGEFELPPWRAPSDIADADARAMIESVRAGAPDDEVLVAERSGRALGVLHVLAAIDFFGRRHAHVSVIAISKAAEGSGVGRALLAHADEWARARRLSLLTLNVFAGNARARRFYERAGFLVETLKYAKRV